MHVRVIDQVRTREEGQTMAEYAVVLGVITPAILLAIGLLSGSVQDAIARLIATLGSAL